MEPSLFNSDIWLQIFALLDLGCQNRNRLVSKDWCNNLEHLWCTICLHEGLHTRFPKHTSCRELLILCHHGPVGPLQKVNPTDEHCTHTRTGLVVATPSISQPRISLPRLIIPNFFAYFGKDRDDQIVSELPRPTHLSDRRYLGDFSMELHEKIMKECGLPDEIYIATMALQLLTCFQIFYQVTTTTAQMKPGAIRFNKKGKLLIDWGMTDSDQRTSTGFVSPIYYAPEALRQDPTHAINDIYAIGVFLYTLAFKTSPFNEDMHPMRLIFEVARKQPVVPHEPSIHPLVHDLLTKSYCDHSTRAKFPELLKHPLLDLAMPVNKFEALVAATMKRMPSHPQGGRKSCCSSTSSDDEPSQLPVPGFFLYQIEYPPPLTPLKVIDLIDSELWITELATGKRVQVYGYNFISPKIPDIPLPPWARRLRQMFICPLMEQHGYNAEQFDQLVIREYTSQNPMMEGHIDKLIWGEPIFGLSVGGNCRFSLIHPYDNTRRCSTTLQSHQVYLLTRDARYAWKHEITGVTERRISLTFRCLDPDFKKKREKGGKKEKSHQKTRSKKKDKTQKKP